MTAFPKTRAAAGYAARHSRAEPARASAAVLLERLAVCEEALTGGEPPLAIAGLLRGLIQATHELATPGWLAANAGDPDVAAFTTLQATASPPDPARVDELCARVLWARFAPAGTPGEG